MSHDLKKLSDEIDWRIRVFDSLSFPTLILKADREIVSANSNFLEKFDVELDELVGLKCCEFLYYSDLPCPISVCPITRVIEDRKGHSILKQVNINGEERWEDRVFSPILTDDGEVAYIIQSFRDVTRVKTLERTLKETENFLEKVVQSSPSAILAADTTGHLLLANEAAEDLFGYSIIQDGGTITSEDLYPPGKAREIMRMLREESAGGRGKLANTKTTILTSDGTEIPVEMTASIIYEGGKEVATMAIYNDLREKMAVEKQLRDARDQLVQAEKLASLGQLAAGVAHEINNPLTGIMFYANLALESLAPDNPLREDLGYVIEDSLRCKEIVKNLLAYSRQQSTSKMVHHINEIVDKSLALIRDQKVFREVQISKELQDSMMMVYVDRMQFTQVIINLVMNAVAAMDGKGTLTLRTYRDKNAQKVFLEVEDTGCGILKENLSKVFDPFFTTKEPGKGTGLGLSTVYGIVQDNAGLVSVKSTGPTGTTFMVELPLFQPSENTLNPNESNS
jgi:PAS domain S-box-containing protein